MDKYFEREFTEYLNCNICNNRFRRRFMSKYKVPVGKSWIDTHICGLCTHDNQINRHPETNKKLYSPIGLCNHTNNNDIFNCVARHFFVNIITRSN